jgi:galactan 5-O-arabinofuranosyltransferase
MRPWLFAAAVAALELGVVAAVAWTDADPYSTRTTYGLYVAAAVAAAVCVGTVLLARRQGRTWDADLIPAVVGGFGSLVLLVALHGTPYGLAGILSDQAYRTETVMRFAQSWRLADYGYPDLPSYYAPGYFWVLGRVAALTGIAPFHMVKYGVIAVAFLAPVISYVMWRRLVPDRVAALTAFVPLIAQEAWEPYGWLVLAAVVPWWLEAVHGLTRPGLRPRHPVLLGVIGGLLFCTYYYYFFVFAIAWPIHLVVTWRRGELTWRGMRRPALIAAVAAAVAAPYWLPLAVRLATAPEIASLNNRYIPPNAGELSLPMTAPTVVGALCLLGLGYLIWTVREPISRSLLIVAAAIYLWHGVGYLAVLADTPLLSFRMRALVPVVLLTAAALALPRLAGLAAGRWRERGTRLVAVGGLLLAVTATTGYAQRIVGSEPVAQAHGQPLPNGRLPRFHRPNAKPASPSAERLSAIIDAARPGGASTIVTTRSDLLAHYPYRAFVWPNAHFSHPAARFYDRVAFLTALAQVRDPDEFARRCADNPHAPIDAFVLRADGRFAYNDDIFPYGSTTRWIDFNPASLSAAHFTLVRDGAFLVAVRRVAAVEPAVRAPASAQPA